MMSSLSSIDDFSCAAIRQLIARVLFLWHLPPRGPPSSGQGLLFPVQAMTPGVMVPAEGSRGQQPGGGSRGQQPGGGSRHHWRQAPVADVPKQEGAAWLLWGQTEAMSGHLLSP